MSSITELKQEYVRLNRSVTCYSSSHPGSWPIILIHPPEASLIFNVLICWVGLTLPSSPIPSSFVFVRLRNYSYSRSRRDMETEVECNRLAVCAHALQYCYGSNRPLCPGMDFCGEPIYRDSVSNTDSFLNCCRSTLFRHIDTV